tara:strand:- start:6779 stop:7297 length:519 start_codon:yes stop_codon:yes gene_type:complete
VLVFDIETNGLIPDVDEIHCLSIYDTDEDHLETYNNQKDNKYPVHTGLQRLCDADCIAGHNIINYDLRVCNSIYNWFKITGNVVDTLLLSHLFHPNIIEIDKKHKWPNMPMQLYGRHSLEAYGHRLGEYKGGFGKTTDWKSWSQEMQHYCEQDVRVTTKLCKHFHPYLTGAR